MRGDRADLDVGMVGEEAEDLATRVAGSAGDGDREGHVSTLRVGADAARSVKRGGDARMPDRWRVTRSPRIGARPDVDARHRCSRRAPRCARWSTTCGEGIRRGADGANRGLCGPPGGADGGIDRAASVMSPKWGTKGGYAVTLPSSPALPTAPFPAMRAALRLPVRDRGNDRPLARTHRSAARREPGGAPGRTAVSRGSPHRTARRPPRRRRAWHPSPPPPSACGRRRGSAARTSGSSCPRRVPGPR